MITVPAFDGFSEETLAYLREIEENNNKAWFDEHKPRYKKHVQEPALAFVMAVGEALQETLPKVRYDLRTNGGGSLMRIRRDTRFSADKTPYKTNVSGMWWEGVGRKTESPAFGFQLESRGMRLMAGMFQFPKPMLHAYREAVDDEVLGPQLSEIVETLKARGDTGIHGAHYKRIPRGYDADHPRAALLKHNALYAFLSEGISLSDMGNAALVDQCVDCFLAWAPLQQWLVEAALRAEN